MCFATTEEINKERKGSTDRERFICQADKKYGVTAHHIKSWWAQKDRLKNASRRKPFWKPQRDCQESDNEKKKEAKYLS